ncbi:MAG: DNA replication/repair protein RecF [Oligoflexia bacterium]|nr:DNA replication/repair protein RecF [Oligoflexia bacterium]
MKVVKLTLHGFRNIQHATFDPDSRLNFLVGKNGQGKTSFLEAIGFVSGLKSFRGSKTAEVIRHGDNFGEISCEIEPEERQFKSQLKVTFAVGPEGSQKATKAAFINGKPFRSAASYLSQRFGQLELGFHAIIFNPSDHDLVRGEPAIRRNYLDRVLAAEDIAYLKTYQKYQRVLEQRNALLKSEENPSRELLLGFSEPLAHYGAMIGRSRLEWIERLSRRLDGVMRQIAPAQAEIRLVSLSNWIPPIACLSIENNNLNAVHFAGHSDLPSLELLEQAFRNRLASLESAEFRARSSLVGPHRDDWAFFQENPAGESHLLKGQGSQGEIRSALLALKLSEIELFRERTGHRPLFLLDDFSSELDQDRRKFLLKFLSETDLQVFVTTTDDSFLFDPENRKTVGKRFQVSDGMITEA